MTAASRRSLGSVSVPVRRVMLSHPLSVVALVSFYLTNKLIEHRSLSKRLSIYVGMTYVPPRPSGIIPSFGGLFPSSR